MEEDQSQIAPRTSGLAIVSLLLAIVCLGGPFALILSLAAMKATALLVSAIVCIVTPIALILSIVSLKQISGNLGLRGRGMALAGTIIGSVAILIDITLIAIVCPVLEHAKIATQRGSCISNLKQLNTAMEMYALDHGGRFPAAEGWNESLDPYLRSSRILVCPTIGNGMPSYGMNDRITGIPKKAVNQPARVVSFFDSVPGRSKHGGPELLPSPPRHTNRVNNVSFVDGHAYSYSDARTLNWDPGAVSEKHLGD